MTTLLLQAADTAIGGVAGAATSYLGGALAGALTGSSPAKSVRNVEGPRLSEMNGVSSTEGASIPRLYGRARLGGQLIWATRFQENANTIVTRDPSSGGKSLGGSSRAAKTTVTTTYSYTANLAIGLCEGPIAFVRRIWADSREIDQTTITVRVHRGDEDQEPDPLIVAKEGAENAPAYRGLAYVVFEGLPLGDFGNRVPQFSFEVVRPVDGLREMIRSVCLIPGATEFGYDTVPVSRDLGLGATVPENRHQLQRTTDVAASLDWLGSLCPNLRHVSLVVSWFGDDLRAGHCTVAPRIEVADKTTTGAEWSVVGLDRLSAREVSKVDGRPAYGGTPSDDGVVRLIGELKGRGYAVTLYPFLMMDVPAGNGLPDPQNSGADQPPYPWRGRITCDPAPGQADSPDGSGGAGDQVATFFGSEEPGPDEWSFRRLVFHCCDLAGQAGGVDGFVIGSELVGLTRVRNAPGSYPAVAALRRLAADVRGRLDPGTRVTYAADWTEYGAHVPATGEVRFPLDPLWADPAIDAIGIDQYAPMSDWRDAPDGADWSAARSIYDADYLRDGIGSGPDFDWYYATDSDRLAQIRTPITDGAYGKPWIYRAKDLVGWWSNPHLERVGGVEIGATAWQPCSKPIWLTEVGVPAVDKGTNGPNVFPDPKSSESAVPPFSRGTRDDLIQARGLQAILTRFDPSLPGHRPADNPGSPIYGGPMIDPSRASVWAWDTRPFPAFPNLDAIWADGANWDAGHWITGRIEGAPLDRLVRAILSDYGLYAGDPATLDGFVDGYVIDRPMSARAALEPLGDLFGFDVAASAGRLVWRGRGGRIDRTVAAGDLVAENDDPLLSRSRAQETELPSSVTIGFTDGEGEYGRAAVTSRRLAGTSRREASRDAASVTRRADAQRLADIALQDAWAGRDSCEFSLSPREIGVEVGDVLALETQSGSALHRVTRIVDGASRRVTTVSVEPAVFTGPASAGTRAGRAAVAPALPGRPLAVVLDLPAAQGDPTPLQYLAVAADPWPGAVAVWRAEVGGGNYSLHAVVDLPAVIGRTLDPLSPGPVWCWDRATRVRATFSAPALSSIEDGAALAGGNLFAVEGTDGTWEIVSAARAEVVGSRTYELSRFLRGLAGTDEFAARTLPKGATIVRLDEALVPLATKLDEIGRTFTYRIGPAGRDYADPTYVELSATVGTAALLPFAPVHLSARRAEGGIVLTWIRRTRIEGDGWDLAEVPLGEARERYEVQVLSGGDVVRTIAAEQPEILYLADQELDDFGAPQPTLSVRVTQVSDAVGRGFWRTAELSDL